MVWSLHGPAKPEEIKWLVQGHQLMRYRSVVYLGLYSLGPGPSFSRQLEGKLPSIFSGQRAITLKYNPKPHILCNFDQNEVGDWELKQILALVLEERFFSVIQSTRKFPKGAKYWVPMLEDLIWQVELKDLQF